VCRGPLHRFSSLDVLGSARSLHCCRRLLTCTTLSLTTLTQPHVSLLCQALRGVLHFITDLNHVRMALRVWGRRDPQYGQCIPEPATASSRGASGEPAGDGAATGPKPRPPEQRWVSHTVTTTVPSPRPFSQSHHHDYPDHDSIVHHFSCNEVTQMPCFLDICLPMSDSSRHHLGRAVVELTPPPPPLPHPFLIPTGVCLFVFC
jgi:hypothetical protein